MSEKKNKYVKKKEKGNLNTLKINVLFLMFMKFNLKKKQLWKNATNDVRIFVFIYGND
jgi:hypothetical protein